MFVVFKDGNQISVFLSGYTWVGPSIRAADYLQPSCLNLLSLVCPFLLQLWRVLFAGSCSDYLVDSAEMHSFGPSVSGVEQMLHFLQHPLCILVGWCQWNHRDTAACPSSSLQTLGTDKRSSEGPALRLQISAAFLMANMVPHTECEDLLDHFNLRILCFEIADLSHRLEKWSLVIWTVIQHCTLPLARHFLCSTPTFQAGEGAELP